MRQAVLNLEESKIREVANAGFGSSDVLPFWFGESDEVTPEAIRAAGIASLQAGETFYSHNLGLPELRQAVADYTSRLHRPLGPERIGITSGGVSALIVAMQALIDAGDRVVAVTPVWPNLTAQPRILGADLHCVPLHADADGAWRLDLPALLAAITPGTRLLVVNSPNNPTGWTLSQAEQAAILDHCRGTGTWILADEVYERLYYAGDTASGAAPSFLDVARPDDRLVVVQSFSKAFLMTGWRLGYLVMPADMTPQVGKLLEFNTSCAPVFVQRAALAAVQQTEAITPRIVAHLKGCRDALVPLLQAVPGVRTSAAPGGMYAFLRIEGFDDSLGLAKRLVAEAAIGLAPGVAFGPEAEGWLRWCFASKDVARLGEGVARLRRWLG
ncbi:pyridoxal phosphate-dependent aminotransferase [Ottowia sp.]|uniref:pyridoxal phosphate-dependent aminotransferase n=1 Tax=Ottowia sp. TaxID=1898956 RepID=UPI0039E6F637